MVAGETTTHPGSIVLVFRYIWVIVLVHLRILPGFRALLLVLLRLGSWDRAGSVGYNSGYLDVQWSHLEQVGDFLQAC